MIGDIVQAKREDGQYFYGVIEEVRVIIADDAQYIRYNDRIQHDEPESESPQTQYRVRSIRAEESTEEWSASVVKYEALRRWGGPIMWIEEWISSR